MTVQKNEKVTRPQCLEKILIIQKEEVIKTVDHLIEQGITVFLDCYPLL